MIWRVSSGYFKVGSIVQVVIEIILIIIFAVGESSGPVAYDVQAGWIFHILALFCALCCVKLLRSVLKQLDRDEDEYKSGRALQVMISWVFILNCLSFAMLFVSIGVHKGQMFLTPPSLANAGTVAGIAVLNMCTFIIAFYMLLAVWTPGQGYGIHADHAPFTARSKKFNLENKFTVDLLEKPRPARIIDLKKSSVFDKKTRVAGTKTRGVHKSRADRKHRQPAWDMMSSAEAGRVARPSTNPFEDPHFEVVSLD